MDLSVLLDYTAWDREQWKASYSAWGTDALRLSMGPETPARRFATSGELVRHIFTAELTHLAFMAGEPLPDPSAIPTEDVGALFEYGESTRRTLSAFIEAQDETTWDVPYTVEAFGFRIESTPRKSITHVLLHEVRHWAQLATLHRQAGYDGPYHDFLASPVFGGGVFPLG